MNLDTFLTHYIACALWSSTDDAGDPLDAAYSVSDFAPEALATMREDCADFIRANAASLDACGLSVEQCGHDFWLTRNHHGAGFWDRGIGVVGDALTQAAQAYGSCDVYVGDNGKLYV